MTMQIKILIFSVLFVVTQASLVEIHDTRGSSDVCCTAKNILSCQEATVNPSALASGEDLDLAGITVSFVSNIEPNGYVYKNDVGDEAIITFNEESKNMFGSFKTHDGKSFVLEKCSTGHTWQEYDVPSFKADKAVKLDIPVSSNTEFEQLRLDGAADNITSASYSVMFYYTPEFIAITSDISGYIDQVLAETNQGYANSGVPFTVTKFCVEAATINDIQDTSEFINAFANMKPSAAALRNTADAAALLAVDFNSCGVAYMSQISSGYTLSVCQKSCALGYFSFGHELGHNMGLTHNPEAASNNYYSYGTGHLIQQGTASTGYRTILAYNANGHSQRVNYYSNPDIKYPPTGTPTGVVDVSNNAAVLLQNRLAMQSVGDESATCGDNSGTPSPTPTPTPISTPIPSPSPTTTGNCGNCVFPFVFNERIHNTCTTIDGDATPWCATTVDESGNFNGGWEYCESSCPGITTPTMQIHPNNAVGSCFCGVPNMMNSQRIVGGVETDIGEYPWQIALLFSDTLQSQGCGGALVSDRYVITAAHCTDGSSAADLKVVVGDTSLAMSNEATSFIINVKTIKQHPDYGTAGTNNDISVLELETPVDLMAYPNIKPVCLPAQGDTFADTTATVSGWGTVSSGGNLNTHLHEVAVTVFGDGNCGSMDQYMTPDMMCAGVKEGGKDACQGDSGGPLLTADPANFESQTLIGVVSWGFGCAGEDALGIYAEVAHFRTWLDEQLTDINTCSPSSNSTTATPAPTPAPTSTPTPSSNTTTSTTTSSPAPTPSTLAPCGSCVFPFVFGGRIHNTCTTIDGDATPWCATEVDENGVYVSGKWEYCTDSSCPGFNPPAMYIHPSNVVGSCSCGVPNAMNNQRIVGDVETGIGEYPWQIALLFDGSLLSQGCGGALVSDRYVITAAHCTDGASAAEEDNCDYYKWKNH